MYVLYNDFRSLDNVLQVAIMLSFRLRCMYDVIVMPWDWPVEVNYLEAKAFCCWKGSDYRLLCEAEYNVIRGDQVSLLDIHFFFKQRLSTVNCL